MNRITILAVMLLLINSCARKNIKPKIKRPTGVQVRTVKVNSSGKF